jgi:hypothetical protein
MSEPLQMACRYHEFAAECVRLAASVSKAEVRDGFRRLASSYLELAEAELTRAEASAARLTESFKASDL